MLLNDEMLTVAECAERLGTNRPGVAWLASEMYLGFEYTIGDTGLALHYFSRAEIERRRSQLQYLLQSAPWETVKRPPLIC